MIKLSYICLLAVLMIIASQALRVRDNTGYKDYNKAVFEAHNKARADPKYYAKLIDAQKSKFVYDSSGNPTSGICMDTSFVAKSTYCSFTYNTNEGVKAYDEAINFLNNFNTQLNQLEWSESLSQSCYDHISAQGPVGGNGHYGKNGDSPSDRISRYVTWTGTGENLSYGDVKYPEDPILQLLVDDGVPSRGHRENIMKGSFTHLGVSCGCHTGYGEMCCFNYGTDIVPKNPSLVAAYAPQLKTCSAYSIGASDDTSGNYVLSHLPATYALTTAPPSSPSTGGSPPSSSGDSSGAGAQTSYSINTSTDSNGMITKEYKITRTVGSSTSNYSYTWSGSNESSAPSINQVYGYLGI